MLGFFVLLTEQVNIHCSNILELFGFERTLRSAGSNPPAMGRNHYTRSLKALSNLAFSIQAIHYQIWTALSCYYIILYYFA